MAFYFVRLFFRLPVLFPFLQMATNFKDTAGDKENVKPNKWRNFWTELKEASSFRCNSADKRLEFLRIRRSRKKVSSFKYDRNFCRIIFSLHIRNEHENHFGCLFLQRKRPAFAWGIRIFYPLNASNSLFLPLQKPRSTRIRRNRYKIFIV